MTIKIKYQYSGELFQYCGGYSVHWGVPSVHVGDNICTVGDNIRIVEGIQYGEGRVLISGCLAIKNDEKILIFRCIMKRNFHWRFRKF